MSSKPWNRLDREAAELWTKPLAEVREQLIVHYMPFAEQLATKRAGRNRRVDPDDVRSEAYDALIGAVDAFDPENERGATFTTFAGWRIRGATFEAERDNDYVGHKVRAADRELRRQLQAGEVDHERVVELVPHMTHFADEHTGKKRGENSIPDRLEDVSEKRGDLAAAMNDWATIEVHISGKLKHPTVREVADLLLDCAWNMSECVRRAQARDTLVNGVPISDELLLACANENDAVEVVKAALDSIGASATICHSDVYQPPGSGAATVEFRRIIERLLGPRIEAGPPMRQTEMPFEEDEDQTVVSPCGVRNMPPVECEQLEAA